MKEVAGVAVSPNLEEEPEGLLDRSFESRFLSSHRRGVSVFLEVREAQGIARGFGSQNETPPFTKKAGCGPTYLFKAVRACP